jgi:hypothetical protein
LLLGCFEGTSCASSKVWPEVMWGARGVFPGDTRAKSVPVYESGSILAEYIKRAWYAVRY